VCDQGTEFMGQFADLLRTMLFMKRTSSAYHPAGNGMAERVVQNILQGTNSCGSVDAVLTWCSHLPLILMGRMLSKRPLATVPYVVWQASCAGFGAQTAAC